MNKDLKEHLNGLIEKQIGLSEGTYFGEKLSAFTKPELIAVMNELGGQQMKQQAQYLSSLNVLANLNT